MAIDTAGKRASALIDDCGILFPPDGAIDTADRIWMLGQYSAFPSTPASVIYGRLEFTVPDQRPEFTVQHP